MKKLFLFISLVCYISEIESQLIRTIAGNHFTGYSGDGGFAISAKLNFPSDIAVDNYGNVFIADVNNNVIRKVNVAGLITTVAGNGIAGYSGDGGLATAAELDISDIAIDKLGNLYISDWLNDVIRKVDVNGIISTYAGTGITGYSGDGGLATAAKLNGPAGITVDSLSNLYFADRYNQVIRKINSSGIITTIAGTGISGFSGDGGNATMAQFDYPTDIAVDQLGNLFVTDLYNYRIRKINSSGIISTFAGTGTQSFTGNGGPAISANLYGVYGITVDLLGNVYVSDGWAEVRVINSSGIIDAFAGSFWPGYTGDGGPAVLSDLDTPYGIASDAAGNVYIADSHNEVIRKAGVCLPLLPEICMVQVDSLSQNNIVYWNQSLFPTADTFYVYRDTANYNFALIGKVLASGLGMYTDTARTIYAANGDPNVTSWRYKIAYGDTCGGGRSISPLSPWHQTIYQYNIGGLFIWNHYEIEGQPTPVLGLQNYLLKRDNFATGNYTTAATAAAASTNINDVQYATYQNTANWRIETLWNISCDPAAKLTPSAQVNKSKSNVKNNFTVTSLNKQSWDNQIEIAPNPVKNELTIVFSKNMAIKTYFVITDVLGKIISKTETLELNKISIPLNDITSGVYFLKIVQGDYQLVKKFVKE